MSLNKLNYVDQVTVIPASNLNDIQDAIIELEGDVGELGTEIEGKADASNVYTKAESDALLNTKADKSDTYSKEDVDGLLEGKANVEALEELSEQLDSKADASNVYTKTEMDTALSGKADSSAVYTKSETDTLLSGKASASDLEELEEEMTDYRQMYLDSLIHTTASGSIASFSDGADGLPMDFCTASIEPKQEGSGDPSPTNIRPISGSTGVECVRSGKNLLPMTAYEGVAYNPTEGAVFSMTPKETQPTDNGDGTFTITFTSSWKYYCFVMPLVNGQTYAYKIQYASTGQAGSTIGYLDKDMKVLTKVNATDASKTLNATATGTDERKYLYLCISNRGTATATITITNPQAELGSTATAYEPYTADTYSVTWEDEAGTVYGGSVDLVSGVLTVDRAMVDTSTLTFAKYGEYNVYYVNVATKAEGVANIVSDMFSIEEIAISSLQNGQMRGSVSNKNIYLGSDKGTLADFTAWVQENNPNFCYELAQPTTYQLTPQEIKTLLGSNNVWADTGDTSVGYVADTKLYIDSKLS